MLKALDNTAGRRYTRIMVQKSRDEGTRRGHSTWSGPHHASLSSAGWVNATAKAVANDGRIGSFGINKTRSSLLEAVGFCLGESWRRAGMAPWRTSCLAEVRVREVGIYRTVWIDVSDCRAGRHV